jgi:hypothetical protein
MGSWERESRTFYVYIMGSKSGVLYIGITNNLERRLSEHREGLTPGFAKKYRTPAAPVFRGVRPAGGCDFSREANQRLDANEKTRIDSLDESGDGRSWRAPEHARFFAAQTPLRMTELASVLVDYMYPFLFHVWFPFCHPERSLRSEGSRPPRRGGAIFR